MNLISKAYLNDLLYIRFLIFIKPELNSNSIFVSENIWILKIISKVLCKRNENFYQLPINISDEEKFNKELLKEYSNFFSKNHPNYLDNLDKLKKFLRFINLPINTERFSSQRKAQLYKYCKNKNIENDLNRQIIQMGNIDNYIKLNRNQFYPFNNSVHKYIQSYFDLRRKFNNNFPFNKNLSKVSINNYDELVNAFVFSLIVNSFISDTQIINKLKSLKIEDINFEKDSIFLNL